MAKHGILLSLLGLKNIKDQRNTTEYTDTGEEEIKEEDGGILPHLEPPRPREMLPSALHTADQ